jgi:hypothetical protein
MAKHSTALAAALDDPQFDAILLSARQDLYVIRTTSESISPSQPNPPIPSGSNLDIVVTQRLARLAPSLSDSALRLFIYLWSRQLEDLSSPMYLSQRDLSAATGQARNSIAAALDQLFTRSAIALRWGDSKRPNRIFVTLWRGAVLSIGGSNFEPPPREKGDRVAQNLSHPQGESGAKCAPPYSVRAQARIEFDSKFDIDIDRSNVPSMGASAADPVLKVLTAAPSNFSGRQLYDASQMLFEAMRRRGSRPAKPPDDVITAQFLSAGPWPALQRLLIELIQGSGAQIHHYGYFVAAALDRCQGVKPAQFNAAREQLRPVLVQQRARPVQPVTSAIDAPAVAHVSQMQTRQEERETFGLTEAQFSKLEQCMEADPPGNGAEFLRLIDQIKAEGN